VKGFMFSARIWGLGFEVQGLQGQGFRLRDSKFGL
jgi:hypothetical protein